MSHRGHAARTGSAKALGLNSTKGKKGINGDPQPRLGTLQTPWPEDNSFQQPESTACHFQQADVLGQQGQGSGFWGKKKEGWR